MAEETAVAAGGAPAAAPASSWFAGQDAETIGHLQNRGWDKLPPDQAALQAVKAYREAEKHIGVPPDQIIRMPKDVNDKDGWNKLYSKLGVPDKPEGYDFKDIKFSDGSELTPDLATKIRTLAAEQHLSKDAAAAVAKSLVALAEEAESADSTAYQQKLETEKGTLRTNWGSNAAAYKVIAENAAQKLGVTAEEIGALEKTIGYARVMDMFRNIGQRIGEDKFIGSGGPRSGVIMTQQEAAATLASRERDAAWVEKLNNGDTATIQEFDNLTRLKSGYVG